MIIYTGTTASIRMLADILLSDPARVAAQTDANSITPFNGDAVEDELLDYLCLEVA